MKVFAGYLIFINICGLTLICIDKYRALKKLWRISERTLLLVALLGGGIGTLAGMYLVRHKTRKPVFFIGVPLIIIIELFLFGLISQRITAWKSRPSVVVSGILDQAKNPSEESIEQFVRYETRSDIYSEGESPLSDEAVFDAIGLFFHQFDYHINSEEISKDRSHATVKATIRNIDTHMLARDICTKLTQMSAALTDEASSMPDMHDYYTILGDMISSNDYPLVSYDVDFDLHREGKQWAISSGEELQDEITGGFCSYINDPYLLEPEDVLTIYLDQFLALTPGQWLWYLQIDDIFSTGSDRYSGQVDLLYAKKLDEYFSYKITDVNTSGDISRIGVELTSIDMKSILLSYRTKLLEYADSTDSITDDSTAIADTTALFLIDALTDDTHKATYNPAITLKNDGHSWQPQFTEDITNLFLGDIRGALEAFTSGQ